MATSRPSVMGHSFARVPRANIPRSSFNRSHGHKTTFDSGYLVPVFVDEALPGDTFSLNMTAFARLATPLHPFMDNLFMSSFFFAVPVRLLWENWERFNGAQDNPEDSTDYLIPQINVSSGGYAAGSLADYFGIPVGIENFSHSALWHRAYNLIWNDWFRDENLQDAADVPLDDGPDSSGLYFLRRRGKRHDYFTSCLPWPQKGPSVQLPLGDEAPVTGIGNTGQLYPSGATVYETGGTTSTGYLDASNQIDQDFRIEEDPNNPGFPNIRADLTEATAATINELRQAFQIQKIYERDARGGTRYTEIVRSHFGVISPDARLQRPEYLGGGESPVYLAPLPQTSATLDPEGPEVTTPLGNLAAVGTVTMHGHGFTKSFTEHCILIGLVSVRADLNYQQSLNRMWSRRTRFDYYWPALSHIGEQAVLNQEIYLAGLPNQDTDVFGYQERHAEYRYKPSLVTGEFRSSFPESLDTWHLAQDFQILPTLSDTFIEDVPPVKRVLAVEDAPEFLFDSFFSLRCARPMPMYSVPGLIDHF